MSEIVITITENKIRSFNAFNDAILLSLFDSSIPKIEKKGFCVSDYEIYEHPQIKFLKVYVADKLKTFQGVTYYTIYNYRAIGFTMRSQGALSEKQEKVIQDLVDSIKFNNVVVDEKADKSTPSFSYTDSYSKVVFTVPENWEQKQLSEPRQYTDVKFVSTQEEGMTITYEGIDLWGRMTKLEKRGHSRSSINLSFFTDSEIEELIGVSVENMKAVTYDNISYYQTEQCISSIIYGLPISMVMTQVIRIENGWMYIFQFSGEPDHKYFEDFISLINSVEYPQPEPEDYVVEKTVRSKDVVIAILILVTFVVVIVFVLHNNKKVYAKNDS